MQYALFRGIETDFYASQLFKIDRMGRTPVAKRGKTDTKASKEWCYGCKSKQRVLLRMKKQAKCGETDTKDSRTLAGPDL